jgi:hypothetical protein
MESEKNKISSIVMSDNSEARRIKTEKMLATKKLNRELKELKKVAKTDTVKNTERQILVKQKNDYFKTQKKIQTDKLKANKIKAYHLNASCTLQTIWTKNGHVGKDKIAEITAYYFKTGLEYRDGSYSTYHSEVNYAKVLYEPKYNEAEQLFKEECLSDYLLDTEYVHQSIIKFNNISHVVEGSVKPKDIKTMMMRASVNLTYNFIAEDKHRLTDNDCCVLDNFLGTYKHIKKPEFIRLANEIQPCDESTKAFTPAQLQHICIKKDISHYAVDLNRKCFLKHVSINQNYPALVYFAVNEHMYHITNKEEVKSLIASAVAQGCTINSICFDQYEKKNIFQEEGIIIYDDLPMKEAIKKTESCIVMYNKSNLNTEVLQLLDMGIVPDITKCTKKVSK